MERVSGSLINAGGSEHVLPLLKLLTFLHAIAQILLYEAHVNVKNFNLFNRINNNVGQVVFPCISLTYIFC